VGLDPNQIIEIRNLIRQLGKKHTVILSSHILPEVQAVCERVIIIDKGRIIADGSPDRLSKDMSSDHRLLARIAGPAGEVEKLLRRLPKIVSIVPLGEKEPGVWEFSIEAEQGTDPRRALFERLAERKWPLMSLRSSELTLEEVFINMTNEAYRDATMVKKTKGGHI
jgi:ABC-2 type transport system ATP-binding protein